MLDVHGHVEKLSQIQSIEPKGISLFILNDTLYLVVIEGFSRFKNPCKLSTIRAGQKPRSQSVPKTVVFGKFFMI
jgi:hypothetical protein